MRTGSSRPWTRMLSSSRQTKLVDARSKRAFGGHDRGAEIFVGALEPRRHVHGVAHDRIIEALPRTDIADQRVAGINTDALTQGKTLPFGRLGAELVQAVATAQGGADRAFGVVRVVERRAEH